MKISLHFLYGFFLILSGCATPYKSSGWNGGYSNMALGNNLYKVSFRGNGYTDSETVSNFFLRRCAELTIEKGFDYFEIIDNKPQAIINNIKTTTDGNYNNKSYTEKSRISYTTRHINSGIIKLFKKGDQSQYAFEAREILNNFGDTK